MSRPYALVITAKAHGHLRAIHDYIATHASAEIAGRYVRAIVDRLDILADHPRIGTPRDDLRPGVRTLAHRRRVTIAYVVEADQVVIIGFHYAGQDVEARLRDQP